MSDKYISALCVHCILDLIIGLHFRSNIKFHDDLTSNSLSSSEMQSDRSSFNNVSEEVLEVKTMLLQLRRVLEEVIFWNFYRNYKYFLQGECLDIEDYEDKCEINNLKNKVSNLENEIKAKEGKIKYLEAKLVNKKGQVVPCQSIYTQVSFVVWWK